MNPKTQKTLALLVLVVGLVLLAYMVTVEGELGLLPLLLVTVGAVWYAVTRLGAHP